MTTDSKILPVIEGFAPGPYSVIGLNSHGMSAIVQGTDGKGKHLVSGWENSTEERRTLLLMAEAPRLYRIAHEQREVIRELVEALRTLGYHDMECVTLAAPFLED